MDESEGQAGPQMSADEREAKARASAGGAGAADQNPADRTPEQVRSDIEQTREQLGDTVEALAAKTDVKGQAKHAAKNAETAITESIRGARHTVTERTADVVSGVQQTAPDSADDAVRRALGLARDNRARLVPALALGLGLLIGRRRAR